MNRERGMLRYAPQNIRYARTLETIFAYLLVYKYEKRTNKASNHN